MRKIIPFFLFLLFLFIFLVMFMSPFQIMVTVVGIGANILLIELLFSAFRKSKRRPNMLYPKNYFKAWKVVWDNGGTGILGHSVFKLTGHKSLGMLADSIMFIEIVNYLLFPGLLR